MYLDLFNVLNTVRKAVGKNNDVHIALYATSNGKHTELRVIGDTANDIHTASVLFKQEDMNTSDKKITDRYNHDIKQACLELKHLIDKTEEEEKEAWALKENH